MIAHEHQQRLRPYLLPGERLLWAGGPQRGIAFQRRDIWVLPLLAASTALSLQVLSLLEVLPLQPVTFMLALALLYVAALRFLYEPWLRRNLLYAVTDRRAIILGGRFRPQLRSHDLAWLPMLSLEQESLERATIVIDEGEAPDGWSALFQNQGEKHARGFRYFRIDKPDAVYDLICRASRNRRADLNRVSANELIG